MIPLIGNRKMSKKRLFILKILEKPKTNHLKRNSKETKFKNVIKIKLIGFILNFVKIKLLFSTVLDILDFTTLTTPFSWHKTTYSMEINDNPTLFFSLFISQT